ncbi:MAG TPA: branched-chain amino acid aminotransferase [Trebonia sp.]|jgi:branched-chain amino acid aminotransferase|nr:branched-chain amino acid aminotransferase [Trebonia sp.]
MTMTTDRPLAGSTDAASTAGAKFVADPGHGHTFTDHMVAARWDGAWSPLDLGPLRPLALHPGTIGLHYAQVIFEGMKAFAQADGSIAVFRPDRNGARFARSAARLAMPPLPQEMFLESVDTLVRADAQWLTDNPRHALYLRPLMFGSEANLMLRESAEYTYLLMAFLAGGFFGEEAAPVSVMVSHEYTRAVPGGTGDVKCGANYGPSLLAQREARDAGCQQVVWLDAIQHHWIEEMGGMNLFFVAGDSIVTPRLTGTLLPGVTRDSLLTLAAREGYRVSQARLSVDDWRDGCRSGAITETFACGTAAVITPVGRVRDSGGDFVIGTGAAGPVTGRLRAALLDVQHGRRPDPGGWLRRVC